MKQGWSRAERLSVRTAERLADSRALMGESSTPEIECYCGEMLVKG